MRLLPEGSLFETSGKSVFIKSNSPLKSDYLLALSNSVTGNYLLSMVNPTIHTKIGDFYKMPILFSDYLTSKKVSSDTAKNLIYSRKDWDSFETSWDFATLPMLAHIAEHTRLKLQNAPYS